MGMAYSTGYKSRWASAARRTRSSSSAETVLIHVIFLLNRHGPRPAVVVNRGRLRRSLYHKIKSARARIVTSFTSTQVCNVSISRAINAHKRAAELSAEIGGADAVVFIQRRRC